MIVQVIGSRLREYEEIPFLRIGETMALQGRAFTEDAVQRIASLLANTDMTIAEIAARMGCSRSAVLTINRKRQIRTYDGLRSTWRTLEPEPVSGNR